MPAEGSAAPVEATPVTNDDALVQTSDCRAANDGTASRGWGIGDLGSTGRSDDPIQAEPQRHGLAAITTHVLSTKPCTAVAVSRRDGPSSVREVPASAREVGAVEHELATAQRTARRPLRSYTLGHCPSDQASWV